MSDNDDKLNAKARQSHSAIEDAARQHVADLEVRGVVTGWCIAISISAVEDGEEFDMMYSTHSDGLSKWAQVGLLTMSLDGAKRDGYIDD